MMQQNVYKVEKIVCPAIRTKWLDNGYGRHSIFTGVDYTDIQYNEFYELLYDNETILSEERGFMTSRKRFVDRKEAMAIALEGSQIDEVVNKALEVVSLQKMGGDRLAEKSLEELHYMVLEYLSKELQPTDLY